MKKRKHETGKTTCVCSYKCNQVGGIDEETGDGLQGPNLGRALGRVDRPARWATRRDPHVHPPATMKRHDGGGK